MNNYNPTQPSFGKWVLQALDRSGISQAELARRMSAYLQRPLDRTQIHKICTGARNLKAQEIFLISSITKSPLPDGWEAPQWVESWAQISPSRGRPSRPDLRESRDGCGADAPGTTGSLDETRLTNLIAGVLQAGIAMDIAQAEFAAQGLLEASRIHPDRGERGALQRRHGEDSEGARLARLFERALPKAVAP